MENLDIILQGDTNGNGQNADTLVNGENGGQAETHKKKMPVLKRM